MLYTHNDIQSTFDSKVKQLTSSALASPDLRQIRSACDDSDSNTNVITLFNNTGFAILFILILIVLVFLLLGVCKGLLGIYCCPPIGMCGLGALIDLPRPLSYYQEPDLQEYPVQYDVIGWPVHPQTGKRTVRAISIRTEFCLNVIFFLTYPVIMIITLLSLCCFSKVYDTQDTNKGYKDTQTIMLTEVPSFMKNNNNSIHESKRRREQTIYSDNDSTEETDTRYVLEQLRKSEERLKYSKK